MEKIYYLLISVFSILGNKAIAQHADIIGALAKNGGKINTQMPISDSLVPFKVNAKQLAGLSEEFDLTRNDALEISGLSKQRKGEKLKASDIPGVLLIPALTLYKGNSLSVSFMEKNKPFYILSIPLLFDHGDKALINVDLVGGGGYTYLLIKQQGKWVVKKEMVRWIV